MRFKDFNEKEYGQDLLIETVCEIQFPIIMKISSTLPSDFHDILRGAGYLRFIEDSTVSVPNAFDPVQRQQVVFQFSDDNESKIRFSDNWLSLSFTRAYTDFEGFKDQFNAVLSHFIHIYRPAFFSRVGLRCTYVAANTFLSPNVELKVKDFVPSHIFSDFEYDIINDVTYLTKTSGFFDGDFGFNVRHAIDNVSGNFPKGQLDEETSYLIDIDCFYNGLIGEINDVNIKCGEIGRFTMGIFHWSISEVLQELIRASS